MKIERIDFFYLALPKVENKGDGSQDALLVRVQGGGFEGWGECEASPLVSIAAFVTPMSHSGLKSVAYSLEGFELNCVNDIKKLRSQVLENSFDLLQAPHTLSGVDIALWDLLGKKEGVPSYALAGYKQAYPKVAYASMLFGDTPTQTEASVRSAVEKGFKAVKIGWGPFGRNLQDDEAHIELARKAAGPETRLLVDAGTIWAGRPEEAKKRLPCLEAANVEWLGEPFSTYELNAYAQLAGQSKKIRMAAGEGSHMPEMALQLMEYGKVGFIQIDTGRIGGITPALEVARQAEKMGVQYVNHTFTTSLALSASLQPMAGIKNFDLCEFPFAPSELALGINSPRLLPDVDGNISVPEAPGLGIDVNMEVLHQYLIDARIEVDGNVLYTTPQV